LVVGSAGHVQFALASVPDPRASPASVSNLVMRCWNPSERSISRHDRDHARAQYRCTRGGQQRRGWCDRITVSPYHCIESAHVLAGCLVVSAASRLRSADGNYSSISLAHVLQLRRTPAATITHPPHFFNSTLHHSRVVYSRSRVEEAAFQLPNACHAIGRLHPSLVSTDHSPINKAASNEGVTA
jgi:hypothetical protein